MEEYQLYNGKIVLKFDDQLHEYTVNNKTVFGVTSIISIIAKPALLYWAVNQSVEYLKANLQPGVAFDELQIKNLLDGCKYAHRKNLGKAADIGKMTHHWIEEYIKARINKETPPKRPVNTELNNAIDSFFEWAKKNKVQLIASEQKIYSKKYKYAGTLDLEAMVNGKRTIIDFKTSKAIYDDYFLQSTAYLIAREEETGKKYDGGVMILRLSKEDTSKKITSFEVKKVDAENLAMYKKVFLSCLEIYKWQMILKQQAIINKAKA